MTAYLLMGLLPVALLVALSVSRWRRRRHEALVAWADYCLQHAEDEVERWRKRMNAADLPPSDCL